MSQNQPVNRPDTTTFVPFSARLVAAMRAKETEKKDSLFQDIFADRLAGQEAYQLLDEQFTAQDIAYLAVRTRYFDDFMTTACTASHQVSHQASHQAPRQIVILGAGMDTRAFRLSLPSETVIYELDQAPVLAYKNEMLQDDSPACQRHVIDADLTQPWQHLLLNKGFNPDVPSVWLLEGLLMYLESAVVDRIFSTLSALARPTSQLAFDVTNIKGLKYKPFKGYFQFGLDEPETYLAQYGWDAAVVQPGDEGANFSRFPKTFPPRGESDVKRLFFVTAMRS
ncbi:MAG: SAM-dependent methyltransferase [Leptolyngbyaceae cyanobacterium]